MDYRKIAKDDLRRYKSLKMGIEHNIRHIHMLEDAAKRIKTGASDSTPVIGGTSRAEDKLINNIAMRDRLTLNNLAVERLVGMIDDALTVLNDVERLVLTRMYINQEKHAVERLCEELAYEKSRIYQIKDQALQKFTVAMYAIESL